MIQMFQALALGGGGVRGGIHIGVLQAIAEKRGHLQFPKGIYGCSVGAIVGTAVAFNIPLPRIRAMFDKHFQLSSLLPPLRLTNLKEFPTSKGLFPMTSLQDTLVKAFREEGVDIETAKIEDANQRLFIAASNLTTRRCTLLTGKTPLLSALLCSCAIPLVFQPQILYNHVYVDGGLFADTFQSFLTQQPDVLHVYIHNPAPPIFHASLSATSVSEFVHTLYRITRDKTPMSSSTLWIRDDRIQLLQEVTENDKQYLIDLGYREALRFLTQHTL